ncbi:hypothetical protein OQA88_12980 [Cercophora sp. LCS_1]
MLSTTSLRLAITALLSLSVKAQDSLPTGPTFPNVAPNCDAFHTVVSSDGCWDITVTYGITLANFYEWNPDIEDECATNFCLGYSYCIGVGSSPPASSSSIASSSSPPYSSVSSSSMSSSITSAPSSSASSRPYTILHPITEYNLTTIPVETTFPSSRTQTGQPAACTNWHLPSAHEDCEKIVAGSSSLQDVTDLAEWNQP